MAVMFSRLGANAQPIASRNFLEKFSAKQRRISECLQKSSKTLASVNTTMKF